MVITRYGAQRFSGLEEDVNNLPIDADLLGAIFNSTDTLKFFIFDGTTWNESAGGGGITGLAPNSTILEYSTDIGDYTTPTAATATSGTPANAIDDNTATFWESNAGINESITLDMGSVVNCYGLAYYISTAELATMTETQFQIGLSEIVADFSNDFSTLNMLEQDSANIGINTGLSRLNFDAIRNGSNDAASWDIGTTLSDTQWVMDWELTYNTLTSNTANVFLWIAMTDLDSTAGMTTSAQSGISYLIKWGINDVHGIEDTFNAPFNSVEDALFSGDPVVATKYFCRMIRLTSTTYNCSLYLDAERTNLAFPTINGTCDAGVVNLQYFKVGNFDAGSGDGTIDGFIENLQIFNNTTSPPSPSLGQILRTINKAALTPDQFNFIRFNGVNTQFLTIEGSSGSSLVMVANELKVQLETDPPLTTLHGQFTIPTIAGTPLNGGDPTSSVIADPTINTFTFNNVSEPADPALNESVTWHETLDANNDVTHTKMKIDGAIKDVRWF